LYLVNLLPIDGRAKQISDTRKKAQAPASFYLQPLLAFSGEKIILTKLSLPNSYPSTPLKMIPALFMPCSDPWIALCMELDLASLAVHLIRNEEIIME
jgi:hypothetical protein